MPATRDRKLPATQDRLVALEHAGRSYRCRLQPNPRNRNIRISLLEDAAAWACTAADLSDKSGAQPAEKSGLLPGFDPRAAFIVRVTFPPRVSCRQALAAVKQHLPWIEKQILRGLAAPRGVGRQALVTGAKLLFRGRRITLFVLPWPQGRPAVHLLEDKLICQARRTRQMDLRRLLERWYRAQAESMIREKIAILAPGVTRKTYRIALRAQKSRWGSCSESRTLSFNWKLAMMPDFVVNYILQHELAHLEEMNHSVRFWQLLGYNCPYYQVAKKWLRRHGPELEW
jgi:predicted metal-dependent hydrolase